MKNNRKNITQLIKEMDPGMLESEATIADKINLESYRDKVHLAQELNRELVELNDTSDNLSNKLEKIFWVLLTIAVLLVVGLF